MYFINKINNFFLIHTNCIIFIICPVISYDENQKLIMQLNWIIQVHYVSYLQCERTYHRSFQK